MGRSRVGSPQKCIDDATTREGRREERVGAVAEGVVGMQEVLTFCQREGSCGGNDGDSAVMASAGRIPRFTSTTYIFSSS